MTRPGPPPRRRGSRVRACVGAALLLAMAAVSGCSSDTDAVVDCVTGEGAGRVCAERVDGRIELTARGLRAGTPLEVRWRVEGATEPIEPTTLYVAVDGGLEGSVGVLSARPARTTIDVSGVEDDGAVVAGTITVD